MVDTNYALLFEDYLKSKFNINVEKIDRSWFRLPSGVIVYVNGSKLLGPQSDYGWYDLGFKEYKKMATDSNYYVIILDKLESTFIIPRDRVKAIFSEIDPGEDIEWHYRLRKKNGRYILRPNNDNRDISDIHYVEQFLNKWDQIDDLKGKYEKPLNSSTEKGEPQNQLLIRNKVSTSTKAPLSFIDLQIFLLEEMDPHANYQPIMIKTLLLSGGKGTKDDIAAKIKELNPEHQEQDFKNVPVYEVLEKKRGIVRKEGNEFILNSIELTNEQRQQLVAL